jgi:type VI protein secretion system component Hcp
MAKKKVLKKGKKLAATKTLVTHGPIVITKPIDVGTPKL